METVASASPTLGGIAPESTGMAQALARSFQPSKFDPLLTGGHVQSILGFYLRESCGYVPRGDYASLVRQALFGGRGIGSKMFASKRKVPTGEEGWFWDHREQVDTPDGDWFHADTKYCASSQKDFRRAADGDCNHHLDSPTVILLHGLCSSSNSSLAMDIATAVTQKGMNCICLNFRGCSGAMNSKLGGYHLGFTDDLHHYLQLLHRKHQKNLSQLQSSNSSVSTSLPSYYLVGYSLGANVVLKCLGELGSQAAAAYRVGGAVALCAPLDQTRNAPVLAQRGGMEELYTRNLLNALQPMAREQLRRFCDDDPDTSRFDYHGVVNARTITDFDDAFIAPVYGFKNAHDYYTKTSSVSVLKDVRVPTLILNAEDDPFLDTGVWPEAEHCCSMNSESWIRMVRTEHGGHLGFCFHQCDESDDHDSRERRPSWASREAARFLNHVHHGLTSPIAS
jgi:predicted alpha/beta-fold hydrolase